MTPQERQLVDELFDRLASLENAPRDPDAVHAINEGLQRAPNALYPLVQTVLVQDEALKRADARIRELEGELGIEPEQPAQQGGFLDNMRDDLLGRREPRKARCRRCGPARQRRARARGATRATPPIPAASRARRRAITQAGRLSAAGAGIRHRRRLGAAARSSAPRRRPPPA